MYCQMTPTPWKTQLSPSVQRRKPAFRETTKWTGLLLISVVLLTAGITALRDQSALDGFNPNANASISVVVVQPDFRNPFGKRKRSSLRNQQTKGN
jgi:hypothetical protein